MSPRSIMTLKIFTVSLVIVAANLMTIIATVVPTLTAAPTNVLTSIEDDLLDARCQSKCLFELEQRHKNDTEIRRQMKHHITTLCKDDAKCSSCILPCRQIRTDSALCAENVCKNALDFVYCKESCSFIEKIRHNKPGVCPAMQGISNLPFKECSATCDNDSDCVETQKCCSGGCSRGCKVPIITDRRLLPIPESITVQERKRKRSAIVRWIMKRMSPMHITTNANLFVVQWRWSVHQHDDTMTPWQTITVRNKMYTILKHILSPGRYYSFRVAAVNIHGSYGFSKPSQPPFKLSRSVKAPSAPLHLTLVSMRLDALTGGHIPTISWQPPRSDLPLKDYQLSWWKSPYSMKNISELAPSLLSPKHKTINKRRSYLTNPSLKEGESNRLKHRRNDNNDEESDDYTADEFFEYDNENESTAIQLLRLQNGVLKEQKSSRRKPTHGLSGNEKREDLRSTLLPSYSTHAELNALSPGEVYIVELYASIESSDGELRGEPAVLFIPVTSDLKLTHENPEVRRKPPTNYKADDSIKEERSFNKQRGQEKATTMETTEKGVVEIELYENAKASVKFQDESRADNLEKKPLDFDKFQNSLSQESPEIHLQNDDTSEISVPSEQGDKPIPKYLQNTTSYLESRSQDEHFGVELKTPYYERDRLKTALSWLSHPSCIIKDNLNLPHQSQGYPRFRVHIRSSSECVNELPPQEFRVEFCVANFENLQFECEYYVEVNAIQTGESVTKLRFTTAPCEKTPSAVKLKCLPTPKRPNFENIPTIDTYSKATTKLTSVKPTTATTRTTMRPTITTLRSTTIKPATILTSTMTPTSDIIVLCSAESAFVAECNWERKAIIKEPVDIVGYRIILEAQNGTQTLFEKTNELGSKESSTKLQRKFVSAVGPEERRVQLQSLLPNTIYRFRVQPLTIHGLSAEWYETYFRTDNESVHPNSRLGKIGNVNERKINSNHELTHSIMENSLDPLSLSTSSSLLPSSLTSILCILLTVFLI